MRNPSSLFGRFPFYLALLIFSLAGIVSVTGKGTHGNRSTHLHDGITETYFWDFENRLTGLEKPGTGSYSYIYDHRTRRVVRDESGAGGDEAILSFSGGTSVQEWSNSLLVSEQIRGSDWGGGVGGVLYTIRNNQRSYNSYNSRGDVVSASDQTGTATWQASYEAFGTRTQEEGTNAERQRANTKDEDPTGLLNEGFRYRDLETGVFISRDPAGFVDGPNVYTYVRQNPWSGFDPEGLYEFSLARTGQNLLDARNALGSFTSDEIGAALEVANFGMAGWDANRRFEQKVGQAAVGLVESAGKGLEAAHLAAGGNWADAATKAATILGDTPEEIVANGILTVITGTAGRGLKGLNKLDEAVAAESTGLAPTAAQMTKEQAAKLKQFDKKTPANAAPAEVDTFVDGQVLFTAESQGKVPGSKKVYQTSVAPDGETTSYTKTTVTPDGRMDKVTDSLQNPEKVVHTE